MFLLQNQIRRNTRKVRILGITRLQWVALCASPNRTIRAARGSRTPNFATGCALRFSEQDHACSPWLLMLFLNFVFQGPAPLLQKSLMAVFVVGHFWASLLLEACLEQMLAPIAARQRARAHNVSSRSLAGCQFECCCHLAD